MNERIETFGDRAGAGKFDAASLGCFPEEDEFLSSAHIGLDPLTYEMAMASCSAEIRVAPTPVAPAPVVPTPVAPAPVAPAPVALNEFQDPLPPVFTPIKDKVEDILDELGRLKCKSCNKRYARKDKRVFDNHMKMKRCLICKITFGCYGKLRSHQSSEFCLRNREDDEIDQRATVTETPLQNSAPAKLAKKREISKKKMKTRNHLKCKNCAKSFETERSLRIHLGKSCSCNSVSSGKFKCSECNMRFYDESNFSSHQSHKFCFKCKSYFICQGKLRQHTVSCGNNVVKNLEEKKDVEPTTTSSMICELCKKLYKSATFHFGKDRKGKDLICKKCGTKSECRGLSRIHETNCRKKLITNKDSQPKFPVRKVHPEQPPPSEQEEPPTKKQKCAHCEYLCASELIFENHTRPTKCPRCEYLQPCSKLLAQHLDLCRFSGASEPSFKCPMCGQGFTEAALLGSHVVSCTQGTLERRESQDFPCKDCGKVFHKLRNLRSHEERRHSPPDHQQFTNEIVEILAAENRQLKEMFSKEMVVQQFVKREEVESITLDDSDDEKEIVTQIKSEINLE